MTTRRRTARRPTGARPQTRYTWRYWQSSPFAVGAGAAATIILNTVGAAPELKEQGVFGDYTVRRVLGKLFMASLNATESGAIDMVAWGLLIADRDAVAAGALPETVSDAADWFGFGQEGVSLQGSLTAGNHPMTVGVTESRAMRKVNENNQDVVLRIEAHGSNIGSINMTSAGRILVSHGHR